MMKDELPVGWEPEMLSKIIAPDGLFSDGDWVESKDQDPNGSIRLLQLADIGDGRFIDKSSRFVNEEKFEKLRCTEVLENDVLIARMPDPLGRACLTPSLKQKSITVVDVAIVRPGSESVLPVWLMHWINSPEVRQLMDLESTGSTRKRIARGKIAEIVLPIPPLPEQKRIADKLEGVLGRVDACRTRLDRVPALLKRFRQSVLAAATSGRLTEEWRQENGVDEEWENVELGSLIFDGPKNGLYKSSTCYGQGTRILRIDNFYSGYINSWEGLKRLTVSNDELNDFGLEVGDIVVNRVNSMSHLGKSALVRELPEPCVFESNMMRIRLDVARLTPDFCILVLTSPGGIDQLQQNAKQAVNQASINQTDVKSVIVSLPTLSEQAEIVRRVEALFAFADRIEARLAAAQATVARLTPATLAKAFRGELVPQDPDDEPAAALLERIAALKDVVPAKKVRAKRPPRA
jgi:type I restriction enzyme S subunit